MQLNSDICFSRSMLISLSNRSPKVNKSTPILIEEQLNLDDIFKVYANISL